MRRGTKSEGESTKGCSQSHHPNLTLVPPHSTARNPKVAQVQAAYDKAYGSGVEIVGVDDIATGDYTVALAGTPTTNNP